MSAESHTNCAAYLRGKADQSGLDLVVSETKPNVSYPEFPASVATCPHGTRFWVQPTPEEAARLRAMNGEAADD